MAEDKLIAPLPRDEAPNKLILRQTTRANLILALKLQNTMQTTRANLIRALKPRNTMFTQDVLVQQHGAVLAALFQAAETQYYRSALLDEKKAMTQILAVAT